MASYDYTPRPQEAPQRDHARSRVQPQIALAPAPPTPELPTRPAQQIAYVTRMVWVYAGYARLYAPRCASVIAATICNPRAYSRVVPLGIGTAEGDRMDDSGCAEYLVAALRLRVLAGNPEVERAQEIEGSPAAELDVLAYEAECRDSTSFASNLIALYAFLFHSSATFFPYHPRRKFALASPCIATSPLREHFSGKYRRCAKRRVSQMRCADLEPNQCLGLCVNDESALVAAAGSRG
ncbi:hypothetical protein C8R44DRAFT_887071 [Mycena epipterygia]|nr:hypothetical protein C8R44DRAFT_887071 [Mycena epipterygia]